MGKYLPKITFVLLIASVSFAAMASSTPMSTADVQAQYAEFGEFCISIGAKRQHFNSNCANDCNTYDRKTGKQNTLQCVQTHIISCQCPQDKCYSGNKCEKIIAF